MAFLLIDPRLMSPYNLPKGEKSGGVLLPHTTHIFFAFVENRAINMQQKNIIVNKKQLFHSRDGFPTASKDRRFVGELNLRN